MSDTLPYDVVDVFTDHPFSGNQLAVVLDGAGLSTRQMQALAQEFGFSETAFPVSPAEGADYGLRIFTPVEELPFAGHPSVGAAWVLRSHGRLPAGRVVQSCGAGLLPVEVTADGATLTGGPATTGAPPDLRQLLAAVGLEAADLDGDPGVAGCGIDFGFVPVHDEAVGRAVPDGDAIMALGLGTGVCVTSWSGEAAHSRVFVPGVGEDAATGSAAVALGVFLHARSRIGEGTTDYVVSQGVEMGRPSVLRCTVTVARGAVERTTVAGGVVSVMTGRVRVPA